jgi:hypothetical protein
VHRPVAEQRVARPLLERAIELLDLDEDASHLRDRVDAEIRTRSVRGAALRLDVEGDPASVGDAKPLVGRLGDDRCVRAPALEQQLGADTGCLLVGDRRHDHVAAEVERRAGGSCGRNRGEAALHVVGTTAVEAPRLDARRQAAVRLEQADRVRVRVQEQRASATAAAGDADDVRTSRRRLLDVHLEPGSLEPLGDHSRDLRLPAPGRREAGIDRRERDEPSGELRERLRAQSATASPVSADR